MKTTYTTLTIGPLPGALLTARKTRELWASSYLFSYLMRESCKALENADYEVLLPSTENIDAENAFGAGLYPDKLIFKPTAKTEQKYTDVIESVFEKVFKDIHEELVRINGHYFLNAKGDNTRFRNPFSLADVTQYLSAYFKFYGVSTDLDPEKDNLVFELSSYSDTQELQNRLLPLEVPVLAKQDSPFHDWSPLRIFLHRISGTFLFKDGFANGARLKLGHPPKKRFNSLPEIASRELSSYNEALYHSTVEESFKAQNVNPKAQTANEIAAEDAQEETIIANLKKAFSKHFKARHKYVAIVHADGDNVSQIIKNLRSSKLAKDQETGLKDFSAQMLQFARKATEEIVNYGGSPVYMGGDDMLFFAPVANKRSAEQPLEVIFDLVEELDKLFVEYFKKYIDEIKAIGKDNPTPTLSYGIAITYYKYPLYEAKNKSFALLEQVKNNIAGKNAINVQLQKHSGQGIPFVLKKSDPEMYQMIRQVIKSGIGKPDFLNSFTYKLETQAVLLKRIAHDKHRLEHFFKNYFNEEYSQHKAFFIQLAEWLQLLAQKNKAPIYLTPADFQLIYGTLRFIHFINSEDKDD